MNLAVAIHTNGQTSRWYGVAVDGRPRMGHGVICRFRMMIIRSRRGVQHELCTWRYRFKKREQGDAYEVCLLC